LVPHDDGAGGEPTTSDELVSVGRYEWERVVRRVVMTKPIKLLALILSTYADPDGSRIRPGNDVLAAVTGDSEKNVRRILKVLREDFGLVQQVSRGGGRGGKGRAAQYQLTIPTDLLDRVVLLGPGERATKSLDLQGAGQSGNPTDTQLSGQTDQTITADVDSPDIQMSSETAPGQPIDRTLDGSVGRLTGHPGPNDRTPESPTTSHRPTTTDQPTGQLPAQPQTASLRESEDNRHLGESAAAPAPDRCPHGLVARQRPDGTSSCALCRRHKRETEAAGKTHPVPVQNGESNEYRSDR
jgi:hypothetical protein